MANVAAFFGINEPQLDGPDERAPRPPEYRAPFKHEKPLARRRVPAPVPRARTAQEPDDANPQGAHLSGPFGVPSNRAVSAAEERAAAKAARLAKARPQSFQRISPTPSTDTVALPTSDASEEPSPNATGGMTAKSRETSPEASSRGSPMVREEFNILHNLQQKMLDQFEANGTEADELSLLVKPTLPTSVAPTSAAPTSAAPTSVAPTISEAAQLHSERPTNVAAETTPTISANGRTIRPANGIEVDRPAMDRPVLADPITQSMWDMRALISVAMTDAKAAREDTARLRDELDYTLDELEHTRQQLIRRENRELYHQPPMAYTMAAEEGEEGMEGFMGYGKDGIDGPKRTAPPAYRSRMARMIGGHDDERPSDADGVDHTGTFHIWAVSMACEADPAKRGSYWVMWLAVFGSFAAVCIQITVLGWIIYAVSHPTCSDHADDASMCAQVRERLAASRRSMCMGRSCVV